MRVAIVDDMKEDRMNLKNMVTQYFEQCGLLFEIQCFSDGNSFFDGYKPGAFSILLLDLYMDGMNGMEIARQVRALGDSVLVVFITSSEAYAVQSYEVEASNYLLKPVEQSALERALSRCVSNLNRVPQYLEVMANRLPIRIPIASILWTSTYQNAILLHTDGGVVKTYITFERLRELLKGVDCFLMCYKGCLVNMDRVDLIDGDDFVLANGEHVQVRKRGGNQIKQAYIQYLCDKTNS